MMKLPEPRSRAKDAGINRRLLIVPIDVLQRLRDGGKERADERWCTIG